MTSFTQGLLGAGICAVTFAAGIAFGSGRSTPTTPEKNADIKVVLPDRMKLELDGLISDRTACLEWVSRNFKEPNVGQLAMICAGAKL